MVDSPYVVEHGKPRPELDQDSPGALLERLGLPKALRLELMLGDRYQMRRDMEVMAGALQQAIAATHQHGQSEREILFAVWSALSLARNATSTKHGRPRARADRAKQYPQGQVAVLHTYKK